MWASRALIRCRTSPLSSSISLPSASLSSILCIITKPTLSTTNACRLLQYRCVIYNKISKNKLLLNKQRDASYENFMDDEKRMLLLQRIVKLLLKQPGKKMLHRFIIGRGGDVGLVKPQKMGEILPKYPHIIRIYRNPNELDAWVTLAKPMLLLLEKEKTMKQEMAQFAAERLRKVLMLSATRRIRLDRIHYLKEELGLPDDFKKTVIGANPHLFKLVISRVDLQKGISPSVKLLDWDDKLAVPVIEAYREDPASTSGLKEEEKRKKEYSFPINLPPGFKLKKAFRINLRKWQELPYRSPYADTSDLDMNSDEAVKRAVAVIHEFLHVTVEKRTRVDRLAHLRADYKLPQKLGVTVLQNPGIFYLSTKCNVQTIFLREGYKQGKLLNKDPLFSIKEEFMALIKMGRKSLKKPKAWQAELSDGDASDEETECEVSPEEMHSGNNKERIEMKCQGNNEGTDEERGGQEDNELDAHSDGKESEEEVCTHDNTDDERGEQEHNELDAHSYGMESEEEVCTHDNTDDERGEQEHNELDAHSYGMESEKEVCTHDNTDDERGHHDSGLCMDDSIDDERDEGDDPIHCAKSNGIHRHGYGKSKSHAVHKDFVCEDGEEDDEHVHGLQSHKEGSCRENLFETEDDSTDSEADHSYGKARVVQFHNLRFARRSARC